MRVLVINGPNLNLLGTRDQETYGSGTLDDLNDRIAENYKEIQFSFFQSNLEGEIIDRIQAAMHDGTQAMIYNMGGYSHTSVAIRDALEPVSIPKVEVHISNIHNREDFRERSLTGRVSDGIITGFGWDSYMLGVEAVKRLTDQ
ncbi:type II 3-dehydroquinate dehydratase [Balneola sp. MJW-20]|uniref:type II 3-dehydroquinate dehydratase n=1 Tax=Gracilimonas aurantiaca TaxID=3234185 RepID=UPI0034677D66